MKKDMIVAGRSYLNKSGRSERKVLDLGTHIPVRWFGSPETEPKGEPVTVELPTVCDGKEQHAFEEWAKGQRFDMTEHPLHYLFLNERTYAARDGWKAGLTYAARLVALASAPAGVTAAVRGITDDYMTSEAHHPGYVLIPTARFDMLREAEASLASAPAGDGVEEARQTIADALSDSAYLAGVTAGWNAAQADDPNAALAALQQSRSGHMAGYKEAKATLAAALARPHAAVGCEALPEYGEWLPDVWDAYLRELVGWERKDNWARLPATFRWHEFHERLDSAILALQSPPAKVE